MSSKNRLESPLIYIYIYIYHHHHHVIPPARISLTLSRHFSPSWYICIHTLLLLLAHSSWMYYLHYLKKEIFFFFFLLFSSSSFHSSSRCNRHLFSCLHLEISSVFFFFLSNRQFWSAKLMFMNVINNDTFLSVVSWVWHSTISDGEAPILKICGVWSTLSLLLLPSPLWPRVVAPVWVK